MTRVQPDISSVVRLNLRISNSPEMEGSPRSRVSASLDGGVPGRKKDRAGWDNLVELRKVLSILPSLGKPSSYRKMVVVEEKTVKETAESSASTILLRKFKLGPWWMQCT